MSCLVYEKFRTQLSQFEENLQKLAKDIASGIIFERLEPNELWKRAEETVTNLTQLLESLHKKMLILKPEKAPLIESQYVNMAKSLQNFKEILFQKTPDPLANSRLAFEQLRKAVTDGSDLLVLMRQIREEPSQIIDAILRLKAAAETKGPVVTIEAPKEVQPMLEKIFKRIEAARASVISAEKALGEVKEHLRNMQRECLQINNTKKEETVVESSKNEKQLSLSQFKPEGE
ncbi:hypothetical protein J7K06_05285 [Candidatus Bathyarchaeota archaeon]|nr:hypothetical protein [Candidatus Bathyarchaeota archaeon]